MYALGFQTLKNNIALYAVITLVVVMLEMIMTMQGIVTLVFSGLSMLYTHRIIQLEEHFGWRDPMPTTGKDGTRIPVVGYLLRFLALFVVLMLVMTGVFAGLQASGVLDPDEFLAEIEYAMWGIMIGVPVFALILTAFGSVLPACAERGDTSLRMALGRGRKGFFKTFFKLLLGPFALALAFAMLLGQIGWMIGGFGDDLVSRLMFRVIVTILTLIPTILVATVLSQSYLASKPR